MKMRDVCKTLLGGCFVYVAVAACSGGGATGGIGFGGAGGSGHGGSGHGGAGGKDSGIMDALTDPVPDAQADPVSGSRLKAKYQMADDGAKAYLPYVWYDSQRQEDCSFQTAADGKSRCMPSATLTLFFADPACTQPLAYTGANCQPQKYTYKVDNNACVYGNYHIYLTGAKVSPAMVYFGSGGVCSGQMPAGYDFYQVGAEIPASSFVAGSVQHD